MKLNFFSQSVSSSWVLKQPSSQYLGRTRQATKLSDFWIGDGWRELNNSWEPGIKSERNNNAARVRAATSDGRLVECGYWLHYKRSKRGEMALNIVCREKEKEGKWLGEGVPRPWMFCDSWRKENNVCGLRDGAEKGKEFCLNPSAPHAASPSPRAVSPFLIFPTYFLLFNHVFEAQNSSSSLSAWMPSIFWKNSQCLWLLFSFFF